MQRKEECVLGHDMVWEVRWVAEHEGRGPGTWECLKSKISAGYAVCEVEVTKRKSGRRVVFRDDVEGFQHFCGLRLSNREKHGIE